MAGHDAEVVGGETVTGCGLEPTAAEEHDRG